MIFRDLPFRAMKNNSEIRELLIEKLNFFRSEEAITASPNLKFELKKRIAELEKKIKEIEQLPAGEEIQKILETNFSADQFADFEQLTNNYFQNIEGDNVGRDKIGTQYNYPPGSVPPKSSPIKLPVFVARKGLLGRLYRLFNLQKKEYWRAVENRAIELTQNHLREIFSRYSVPENFTFTYGKDNENAFAKLAEFARPGQAALQKAKADRLLSAFLRSDAPYLFVLGASGTGKTTFLQKNFVRFARSYPDCRLVFVYASAKTIEKIRGIERPENTVLFVDALDEDRPSRSRFSERKKEFQSLFAERKFKKVIFSCRTEFFEKKEDEYLKTVGADKKISAFRLELKNFSNRQTINYLQKYFYSNQEKYGRAVRMMQAEFVFGNIDKIGREIFTNPFLLSHIGRLTDEDFDSREEIDIYDRLISVWAKEEAYKAGQAPKEYTPKLMEFSERIAELIHNEEEDNPLELGEIYAAAEKLGRQAAESRTNSFLIRIADRQFAFAHQSIYDYFCVSLREKGRADGRRFSDLARTFYAQSSYRETRRKFSYKGQTWPLGDGYFIENADWEGVLDKMFLQSDILAEHRKFEVLILKNCRLRNINFVRFLKKLKHLFLPDNQISELSALKKLSNLTELGLHSNQISELSALEKLSNLSRLGLSHNQISELSALKKLSNLTELGLGNNQISDLSALEKLSNLTELGLGNNQISDLSALEKLSNLSRLGLRSNQISELSPLFALQDLRVLSLTGNPLEDRQIEELRQALPQCRIVWTEEEFQKWLSEQKQ